MTTKRELERLARKALGRGAETMTRVQVFGPDSCSHLAFNNSGVVLEMRTATDAERDGREMLAAALRGIIVWKEGER